MDYTIKKLPMNSFDTHQKIDEQTLNILMKQIVENIKVYRKEQNMTQLDLAHAMGHKSVGLVSFVEAGMNNRKYNLEHILTIAKILNVPVSNLFVGVDEILKIS